MGDGTAIDPDLAPVRPERSGNDVDQGRFAGAVLPEQGVDAAGDQLDRDIPQHGVSEERLRYAPCRYYGRRLKHRRADAAGLYCCASSSANIASSKFE